MCGKDKFSLITDFAWYISVLMNLAIIPGSKHGQEVSDQLMDIALRADSIRPFAVESMLSLLLNESLILGSARQTVSEVLKAAAWIVGEYSNILTNIMNDNGNNDNCYWIEGPNSEDIRSLWRGKQVHVLVIDGLLHQRATSLPPSVQATYIQAAMKVFIRSCNDCNESEISIIIGTLRNKIGLFLQSQHIEVQERASTLRHILSEFDILSLTWQADIQQITKNENISKKSNDLLDLTAPTSNENNVAKSIDDNGSKQAKLKCKILLTAIQELFYSVHSKAQRKVPIPENLDLNKVIHESALKKILNIEIPENITMSNLFFIKSSSYSSETAGTFDETNSSTKTNQSLPNIPLTSYSSFQQPHQQVDHQKFVPKNPDDNLFYLTASGTKESQSASTVVPLSQMLADSFEDNNKKKKGKDKKHKNKVTKSIDIDKTEMLPAGAISSDDEQKSKKTNRKNHKKLTNEVCKRIL